MANSKIGIDMEDIHPQEKLFTTYSVKYMKIQPELGENSLNTTRKRARSDSFGSVSTRAWSDHEIEFPCCEEQKKICMGQKVPAAGTTSEEKPHLKAAAPVAFSSTKQANPLEKANSGSISSKLAGKGGSRDKKRKVNQTNQIEKAFSQEEDKVKTGNIAKSANTEQAESFKKIEPYKANDKSEVKQSDNAPVLPVINAKPSVERRRSPRLQNQRKASVTFTDEPPVIIPVNGKWTQGLRKRTLRSQRSSLQVEADTRKSHVSPSVAKTITKREESMKQRAINVKEREDAVADLLLNLEAIRQLKDLEQQLQLQDSCIDEGETKTQPSCSIPDSYHFQTPSDGRNAIDGFLSPSELKVINTICTKEKPPVTETFAPQALMPPQKKDISTASCISLLRRLQSHYTETKAPVAAFDVSLSTLLWSSPYLAASGP